jgi:hypothetical protein
MIEDLIKTLTVALEANTKAQNAVLAALGSKGGATGGKPNGGKPGKSGPGVDDMAKAVTEYLQSGDKDARKEAATNVKAIVEHYGVDRFTAIPEASRTEALEAIASLKAGETPDILADDDTSSMV